MSDFSHQELIEILLRAELERAREDFWKATPDSLPAASKRFRETLDHFAALILRGKAQQWIQAARTRDSGGGGGMARAEPRHEMCASRLT